MGCYGLVLCFSCILGDMPWDVLVHARIHVSIAVADGDLRVPLRVAHPSCILQASELPGRSAGPLLCDPPLSSVGEVPWHWLLSVPPVALPSEA